MKCILCNSAELTDKDLEKHALITHQTSSEALKKEIGSLSHISEARIESLKKYTPQT